MFESIFGAKPKPVVGDNKDKRSPLSRRNFLAGASSLTVLAVAEKSFLDNKEYSVNPGNLPSKEESESLPNIEIEKETSSEIAIHSEKWNDYQAGFEMWWLMPYTSIGFVDTNNKPIPGLGPVAFHDYDVHRQKKHAGQMVDSKYKLKPVPENEFDEYIIANVAPEWSDYVEKIISDRYNINTKVLNRINVAQDFVSASKDKKEPKLQQEVMDGEINNVMGIVHYFGDMPVKGAEEYTRIDYLREKVEFHNKGISDFVKNELKHLLPAICAKESKFNDDLTSPAGARGISQFMPVTWDGLKIGEYGESQPLIKQVEAMGKHCDNIYSEIHTPEITALLEGAVLPLFPDRESYERDFLLPVMVNAYNPGAGTMRTAIREFLNANNPENLMEKYQGRAGKDLFLELNKFAKESNIGLLGKYQDRSAEYVGYIYAVRKILDSEKSKNPVLVASN